MYLATIVILGSTLLSLEGLQSKDASKDYDLVTLPGSGAQQIKHPRANEEREIQINYKTNSKLPNQQTSTNFHPFMIDSKSEYPTPDSQAGELPRGLHYIFPPLCSLVLLLSPLNIYLLLSQQPLEALTAPSLRLYISLLMADIAAAIGGISLVVFFETADTDSYAVWFFNNMLWLSFYATLGLLLGMAIIRIVAYKVETTTWLRHGFKTAKLIVFLSWKIGVIITILHNYINFGPTLRDIVAKEGTVTAVVASTCIMNLYVWAVLRRASTQNPAFQTAARIALILSLNFLCCYTFYMASFMYHVYMLVTGQSSMCKGQETTWPWWKELICTEKGLHLIGEFLTLQQSLGNNFVLLYSSRERVRAFFRRRRRRQEQDRRREEQVVGEAGENTPLL